MREMDARIPLARDVGLVVQDVVDEVLVYDTQRHRAHSLNRAAALVWRHCDGRTTVPEMAALLHRELGTPPDEEVVWLALERLQRAHLLHERVAPPTVATRTSRRTLVRRLAMAGGLALVTSVIAPEAAQAASCILDTACANRPPTSCGGTPCSSNGTSCNKMCTLNTQHNVCVCG